MKTTGLPTSPVATRRFLTCCLAVILCLAGAACGQRGPLYLPAQEPATRSAPATAVGPGEQAARETAEQASDEAADSDSDQERDGNEETP